MAEARSLPIVVLTPASLIPNVNGNVVGWPVNVVAIVRVVESPVSSLVGVTTQPVITIGQSQEITAGRALHCQEYQAQKACQHSSAKIASHSDLNYLCEGTPPRFIVILVRMSLFSQHITAQNRNLSCYRNIAIIINLQL